MSGIDFKTDAALVQEVDDLRARLVAFRVENDELRGKVARLDAMSIAAHDRCARLRAAVVKARPWLNVGVVFGNPLIAAQLCDEVLKETP